MSDSLALEREALQLLEPLLEMGPAERAEALLKEGDKNPVLARELAELLEYQARADRDGFLPSPLTSSGKGDGDSPTPFTEEAKGFDGDISSIACYRVLELLGQGGMGIVWSVHDPALNRRLAVKILRSELLSHPSARRRFLEEAHITGQLQHPGIVHVHALGELPDGRPYLVMKLVKGRTLADLLHDRPDPSRALSRHVQVLKQVCQILSYAHSRRVIHRDLKPSNVMVGTFGEVQVMDWGLAKVVPNGESHASDLPVEDDESAVCTPRKHEPEWHTRVVLGTCAYMAPEQARRLPHEFDERTDVFSLGATLYEILTGVPPFRGCDDEEVIAKASRCDFPPPRQISRSVPKALAAICVKAMEGKLEDRYFTAQALADDLERWLADKPVTAYRESVFRGSARWARRHTTLVTSLAMLFLVALIGSLIALNLLAKANARTSLRWEVMNVMAREGLNAAAAHVERAFAGQPDLEAELRQMIGAAYANKGHYSNAQIQLEKAVELSGMHNGRDNPTTLRIMHSLIGVLLERGSWDEAEPLARENLNCFLRTAGTGHPDTLMAALNLGIALRVQGKLAEAESLLRENLESCYRSLQPDHSCTLKMVANLGRILHEQGKLAEAEQLFQGNLEACQRVCGSEHLETIRAVNDLALLFVDRRRLAEAEPLLEGNLESYRRILGVGSPETLTAIHHIAVLRRRQGQWHKAEHTLRDVIRRRREIAHQRFHIARSLVQLGEGLIENGEFQKAEPELREAVHNFHLTLAEYQWERADADGLLGRCLTMLRKYDEAERLLLSAFETLKRAEGVPLGRLERARVDIIRVYEAWDKLDQAARWRAR